VSKAHGFFALALLALLLESTALTDSTKASESAAGTSVIAKGNWRELAARGCTVIREFSFVGGKSALLSCTQEALGKAATRKILLKRGSETIYSFASKSKNPKLSFTAYSDFQISLDDGSGRTQGNQKIQEQEITDFRKQTRVDEAFEKFGVTGKGTSIIFLDSGVASGNPDFGGRCLGGVSYVLPFSGKSNACPPDYNNQGTHGTGVVGVALGKGVAEGRETGIAPEASFYMVKVRDENGRTTVGRLLAGIDWASDSDSKRDDAKIISISANVFDNSWINFAEKISVLRDRNCDDSALNNVFITGFSDLVKAIEFAVGKKGKVIVTTAGTNREAVGIPGCIGKTIVVGAVDSKGTVASFSRSGFAVKDHGMVAPGVGIKTTTVESGVHEISQGTSYSTPMVAGVIALMLEKNPKLTTKEIKEILFETANKEKLLKNKASDENYGHGLVDALCAVAVAAKSPKEELEKFNCPAANN
jgi:subtilisin family serine protease